MLIACVTRLCDVAAAARLLVPYWALASVATAAKKAVKLSRQRAQVAASSHRPAVLPRCAEKRIASPCQRLHKKEHASLTPLTHR